MDTFDTKRPVYENTDYPMLVQPGGTNAYPSGWHEDLEIKIIRSDKMYIALDSQILDGSKGELFFINPYQIHSTPHIIGNRNEYDLLMISLDFFSLTGIYSISLRKIFIEDHIRFNNHITNPHAAAVLDRLVSVYNGRHDPQTRIMLQGLLMEFFAIMLRDEVSAAEETAVSDNTRHYQTIAPALEAIHKSYDRRITSEELAQKCQLTHSYFCRLFKQVMGVTPIDYQTENRLRLADILLQERTLSVADIAHSIGFDDENYFSRCYKKYRGVSPSKIHKAR